MVTLCHLLGSSGWLVGRMAILVFGSFGFGFEHLNLA